ncbi:uncharacterized protein LOC100907641 [Galendromus occidentalis]|uniref:Uncharacterized protein LOC100907641 n=1 Tax=Galendromus occidentalis TaxID=34638 RepID=A0AAJ6QNJ7_9ACAR|nr:uncharacterized protein LOC100907641 [Galendromus occidentalis]
MSKNGTATVQADLLAALLSSAQRAGADAADAMATRAASISTTVRQGQVEDTEHAVTVKLGLRVFTGQRVASVSTTVTSSDTFDALAEQAVAMSRALPENPYVSLAKREIKGQLDAGQAALHDGSNLPSLETLQKMALEAENSALAQQGISKSNGASASSWHAQFALADSDGFAAQSSETIFGNSISVIAGQGDNMQRDYASHVTRRLSDLDPPALLGRRRLSVP